MGMLIQEATGAIIAFGRQAQVFGYGPFASNGLFVIIELMLWFPGKIILHAGKIILHG